MLRFLKEKGFPCDLFFETKEHVKYADNGEMCQREFEIIVIKDGEEIDRFFTQDSRAKAMYGRGFLTALGHKLPSKSRYEKQAEEEKIRCKYIDCAAGMGVAGALRCFLNGDYTNPDCPQFKDEDEFLKESLEKE